MAVGTVSLSSAGVIRAFDSGQERLDSKMKWTQSFSEDGSELEIGNQILKIKGRLSFLSSGEEWKIVKSRDGVSCRNALIDTRGNVQGYWVLLPSGQKMELMFYHRSAQNFSGEMRLEGYIEFYSDSYTCRTVPSIEEKVLNLGSGNADSLTDDSVFSPENDALLQMKAAALSLDTLGGGKFAFCMKGRIDSASQAVFTFELINKYFTSRWVPYYRPLSKKGGHKVPTGWMSWNTYFDKATAEDNLDEAKIGKKYLQPFGCEIWHIESWQGNSDKLPVSDFYNMDLEVNEKQFPKGMKALAEDIRALGFKPGIWMAPFGTGSSDFYEAHKGWFLHRSDGTPVSCWNGRYTLDPTVPEALNHIEKIFHTASFEWGYEYFKVDGMSGRSEGYCAHLYEREDIRSCFHNPSCPNPFEKCVQAIRHGIGEEKYFLACQGHATGPEADYANASRLGADIVSPNEPVKWGNVMNQGRCFLNQAFSHNIVMICDPDTLLVRDLSIEEARVSATIVALPGQLTFFGDKLSGLSGDRMKILQQVLPVTDVRPKNLYPFFEMLPVWNLSINNEKMEPYNVVAFFNWDDEQKTVSVTRSELGIDSQARVALEFWTGEEMKFGEGEDFNVTVPGRGVRVLALHRDREVPFWIGSDRHVTVNAVELSSYIWNEGASSLESTVHLIGGFPLTMHFHIPSGWSLGKVICADAECSRELDGGHLKLTLRSGRDADASLKIQFRR